MTSRTRRLLSTGAAVHDLRSAVRSLRRTPGFLITSVGSLAVALGVCTLTFAAVEAVVHPYVPYRDPGQLYALLDLGWGPTGSVTGADKYAQLVDGTDFYADIAYAAGSQAVVRGPAGPEDAWTETTSDNLFSVLGVRPSLGRLPAREDSDLAGVVVSHDLWQRQFVGRRSLAGATITVDDRTYPVIAVLPAAMVDYWGAAVWLQGPRQAELHDKAAYSVRPVVRLKAGIPIAQVRAELAVVDARLTSTYGVGRVPFTFRLQSLTPTSETFRATHEAMVAAAIAVLLIACANLGNLMLARGLARRHELAVRLALGASRAALVRYLTAEGIVMSAMGAALGAAFASGGIHLLEYRLPASVASIGILAPRLDWRVFGLVLAATALTMGLIGVIPAWRTTRVAVTEPLKDRAGTTTARTKRYSPIVMGEIAITIALLLGAGLLVKAARRVSSYEFGYDSDRLLTVSVKLPTTGSSNSSYTATLAGLEERIRHVDGVEAAAAISSEAPMRHVVRTATTGETGRRLVLRSYNAVDPDFLRTLGIPLIAGRDFERGDAAGAGAVIVDQQVARSLWPHGGAIGGQISFGDDGSTAPWLPVIGIARPASFEFSDDPSEPREPTIYAVVPSIRSPYRVIAVRAGTRVSSAAGARIALDLHRVMATTGTRGFIQPWRGEFDGFIEARRFVAGLFTAVGGLALLLSGLGLFGVLAYTVGQRRREFGIRMALGAERVDMFRLVFHDGAVMVLGGTALGAFFGMWAAKLLAAWLYGVDPTDAIALVSAECVLIGVSFAACVVPAWRAMTAEPLEILRAS